MRTANAVRDFMIALIGGVAIVYTSMGITTISDSSLTTNSNGLLDQSAGTTSSPSSADHSSKPTFEETGTPKPPVPAIQDAGGASIDANAASTAIASHPVRTVRYIDLSRQQLTTATPRHDADRPIDPEVRVAFEREPLLPNIPPTPVHRVAPPPTPLLGVFAGSNPGGATSKSLTRQTTVGVFGNPEDAAPRRPGAAVPASAVPVSFGLERGSSAGVTNRPSSRAADNTGTQRNTISSVGFGNGGVGGRGFRGISNSSKPTLVLPVVLSELQARYTSEAEQARIQGEVTLQVRFLAGGRVEVIRVINSLGHGLDEEARHVAEEIRFTPALRNGEPIDFTTLVHVTFQLA